MTLNQPTWSKDYFLQQIKPDLDRFRSVLKLKVKVFHLYIQRITLREKGKFLKSISTVFLKLNFF